MATVKARHEQEAKEPTYESMPLQYEWDENKRDETWRERKIDFASMYDFDWETAVHQRSDRDGETRWASFGLIGNRLHHVVWTERGPHPHHQPAQGQFRGG